MAKNHFNNDNRVNLVKWNALIGCQCSKYLPLKFVFFLQNVMDVFISSRGTELLGGDGGKKHEVQGSVGTHWISLISHWTYTISIFVTCHDKKEHQFNICRHTNIISSSSFNLYLQVALLDQRNLVDPAEIGKEFVVVVQIIMQAISCQGLTNSETFQREKPYLLRGIKYTLALTGSQNQPPYTY